VFSKIDPYELTGREPERLSILERQALSGMWVAVELYSPETLPLRRIAAVGKTTGECMDALARRGLDPRKFEYSVVDPAY
jgi:hypothetical protein